MSMGGEAFTAANSAVFSYTMKSGDKMSTRDETTHSISHTASYSVHLVTCPGAARQGHLIHSDSMLMQPLMFLL